MILISACLLGHKVRYDGGSNPHELLLKYNERGRFIAVCPECFGQLPVPRQSVEIQHANGKKVLAGKAEVRDAQGHDATHAFLVGADKVLKIAQAYHAQVAILKEGSPSCGVHQIHTGDFDGRKTRGSGVCASLLEANGIRVFSEKDITIGRLEELLAEDEKRER